MPADGMALPLNQIKGDFGTSHWQLPQPKAIPFIVRRQSPRCPLWVLVVQKRSDWMRRKVGKVAMRDYFWARLCPHRRHEGLDAHDVHNAGEIVSQYVQRHL